MQMYINKKYPPKEIAIFEAVMELFEGGADLGSLTVAEITKKAGIGKGTAYEYFSDKEEMIAKALFYHVEAVCSQLFDGIYGEQELYGRIKYILQTMEQKISRTNCFFRLFHVMAGNSVISRRLRELEEKDFYEEIPAFHIVRYIIEEEYRDKEALSKEEKAYLEMSIYSKFLCFGMLLNDRRFTRKEERERMCSLVCDGICREIRRPERLEKLERAGEPG